MMRMMGALLFGDLTPLLFPLGIKGEGEHPPSPIALRERGGQLSIQLNVAVERLNLLSYGAKI